MSGKLQSYPIIGDRKDSYGHMLDLRTHAVPLTWVDWCRNNCSSDCGWLFVGKKAYIGFDNSSDLMWFTMAGTEVADALSA